MAKDNLFLGMARGSVGDVVFSRVDGQQVSRARNRSPRNPQSVLQLAQRIIMATIARAYSLMQEITDHSFQGLAEGSKCQQEFTRLNVALLRDKLGDLFDNPTEEQALETTESNFSYKDEVFPVLNPYIISQGNLPPLTLGYNAVSGGLEPYFYFTKGTIDVDAGTSTITYQQAVDSLGLQAGDQITILYCWRRPSTTPESELMERMTISRIILSPDDGDMSKVFMTTSGAGYLSIQNPNSKNQLNGMKFVDNTQDEGYPVVWFVPASISGMMWCACAVIVSRYENGLWRRSTTYLQPSVISPSTAILTDHPFNEAYAIYKQNIASGLYLNQARI